jgi:hypothetical protein
MTTTPPNLDTSTFNGGGDSSSQTEKKTPNSKEKKKTSLILPISLIMVAITFIIPGIVLLALYANYDPRNVSSSDPGPSQDQIDQRPTLLTSGAVLSGIGFTAGAIFAYRYCSVSS